MSCLFCLCSLTCLHQLYYVFCSIFWSNSWLICNMHWLSLQVCSWVSGHASRRGYYCLQFPLENRRSMSLCKYATAVHTSSLTLRYIMVIDRCVFVYATQRLQTFKCNISQPLHQACIIIAAGTYFEQGGCEIKRGGGGWIGWSRDKSDARHYDPKAPFLLIKVSFVR